ncbi:MAG: hypothetical protein COU46_00220 [Candidatus Niyogibacteria bacterium CG10_big_fil_rev_8_21_14_0_10_42_19]|uniref:50S ribosomal protein L35 n=1 Tax=Candidatus Niyogibacteria bacterium CG10_big_fil_rev_8_21_14_0_10_42_19 TaxID=1974725 RepID=A0A2H0TGL5_9BACT|nr:MAG: hypothetical protein COU46_00220 [Candidatus Niyogibacteria bacterium CG10_big_fil_rev_8_21_14_0_10_42_19]
MSLNKTNKSFAKRLKITKTGKILSRKPGQNHFRAKDKRSKQLNLKKWEKFNISAKDIKKFMPFK